MALTASEMAQLKKIVAIAKQLLEKAGEPEKSGRPERGNGKTKGRRSGKELIAFRKILKAERKAGVPVAQLAKKHGVSPAYIYQLG